MCGICCVLSIRSCPSTSLHSKLLSNLKKRGPDLSGAVENRVLCRQPSHKARCRNSPIEPPLSEDGDVETSDSSKECQEINHLDYNKYDRSKENATSEGLDKENSLIAIRTNTENIEDSHNKGESCAETTDSKRESDIPDFKQKTKGISGECNLVYGSFLGQVLHLRGDPTPQPVEDEQGNILLWNGEVFDGLEVEGRNDTLVLSDLLCHVRNAEDLLKVMGAVRGPWSFIYWQEKTSQLWFGRDFFGRRSLLWLWEQSGATTVTFGLSSVAHKTESGIPVASDWKEVPASGIFCLDVASWCSGSSKGRSPEIVCYPWRQASPKCAVMTPTSMEPRVHQDLSASGDPTPSTQAASTWEKDHVKSPFGDFLECIGGDGCLDNPISPLNMLLPDQSATSSLDCEMKNGEGDGWNNTDDVFHVSRELQEKAEELIRVLGEAVRKRVTNVPLRTDAVHAHHLLPNLHIESHSDDGFKPSLSSTEPWVRTEEDGHEAAHRKEEERTSQKNHLDRTIHHVNLVQRKPGDDPYYSSHAMNRIPCCHGNDPDGSVTPSLDGCQSSPADGRMTGSPGVENCAHAGDVYQECDRDIPTCSNTSSSDPVCCPNGPGEETGSSRVGVLFSGGLDSIVLAALADRYVPDFEPIDLFNVAFEQRNIAHQTKGKDKKKRDPGLQKKSFDVPDRLTGRSGLQELRAINPIRKWNFVEIDVTLEELQAMRSEHLCHLIYPQDTVLDDSIGCAIWFAARGRGKLITHSEPQGVNCLEEPYTSPAKVVLVGMGADEQLAGYSRHRSKFKSEGWLGLLEEIKMEVDRISARNLGRDDRVISDHGRESRLPFLDEDVVSFLNSLPINLKADLNLPRGVGEKLLLRVAAQRLGLGASSKLPKRAIQFGSRIAKLENNREKASDRCNRLEQQVD